MWNKVVCFLMGHDFLETTEFYGKLDNGLATYKLVIGSCVRCDKIPQKPRKL